MREYGLGASNLLFGGLIQNGGSLFRSHECETVPYRFVHDLIAANKSEKTPMSISISRVGRHGRGGRPKTAEMEQRDEHILRVAGEAFLHHGFDATTMDGVAHAAHISKRTLYARYADKTVLFNAVLGDLISRWLIPIEQFETEQGLLKERLLALGFYLSTFALTPQAVAVTRIMFCEAQRQPGFGHVSEGAGRKPAFTRHRIDPASAPCRTAQH